MNEEILELIAAGAYDNTDCTCLCTNCGGCSCHLFGNCEGCTDGYGNLNNCLEGKCEDCSILPCTCEM
jgi:hypothetical protein